MSAIKKLHTDIDSIAANFTLALAKIARDYVVASVAESLGGAPAAKRPRAPKQVAAPKAPKRKAAAKVAAPKKGKRSRTSADVVAKHKQEVLDACTRTARTMQWFKRSDIQAKIEDSSIDVGRMLALNVDSADLVKRGDRRQTEYRLAAKHKTNGATPRTVDRSETQELGDGSV